MTMINWAARRIYGMDLVNGATNGGMGQDFKIKSKWFARTKALNKLADGVLNRLYVK